MEALKSLLDVSVLIALIDDYHNAHARTTAWFQDNVTQGWATCPIAENGCIRILSQPRYENRISIVQAVERVRALVSLPNYEFVADDISLHDAAVLDAQMLSGPAQLTDLYLLALAVKYDMRLATLDARIRLDAVIGTSPSNLAII